MAHSEWQMKVFWAPRDVVSAEPMTQWKFFPSLLQVERHDALVYSMFAPLSDGLRRAHKVVFDAFCTCDDHGSSSHGHPVAVVHIWRIELPSEECSV